MKGAFALCLLLTAGGAGAYDLHVRTLTPIVESEPSEGGDLTFVRDGRCEFRLVWDEKDTAQAKAAGLLKDVFRRAVGAPPSDGKSVLRLVADEGLSKVEAFEICTTPEGVELRGHAWFAALDFAERFLGARWYFPGEDGIVVPKVRELVIRPVRYRDAPHFESRNLLYTCASSGRASHLPHWRGYFGEKTSRESLAAFASYLRSGSHGFSGGGHSPRPERMAAAHPDKLKTIFYTSPNGKFWYNPNGHTGNYYDVFSLDFADLLFDDWKAFYASGGKDDRGGFSEQCSADVVSFGCCDTHMSTVDFIDDPRGKELGLFRESDFPRDPDAPMCNVYARFYQHLANRLKREMPEKKLALLIYYNTRIASQDPRWKLPDNVLLNVCDFRMPMKALNERAMEEAVAVFRDWYEATDRTPVWRAWLYAPRFEAVGRSLGPEFAAEVPRRLGKYLGRGGIFYDFDGCQDIWHYFYAFYALAKTEWNPAFDVDAAIDAMMDDLYGPAAGKWMKRFHRTLKDSYVRHVMPRPTDVNGQLPAEDIDALEDCLKRAKDELREGTVEMRRYRLIADYWPDVFRLQRTLATYDPPRYDVARKTGAADEWTHAADVPLVLAKDGSRVEKPASLKLLWDEQGLYGRFADTSGAPVADANKDMFANDGLELLFTPGLGKEVLYQFVFDTLDRTYAYKQRFLPIPQPRDTSYTGEGFVHRAQVGADGWTAEFFIPWSAFDAPRPKAGESWHANLVHSRRLPGTTRRVATSSAMTLGVNRNRTMFGTLRFMK